MNTPHDPNILAIFRDSIDTNIGINISRNRTYIETRAALLLLFHFYPYLLIAIKFGLPMIECI